MNIYICEKGGTMQVKVLFFGITKDLIGEDQINFDLPNKTSISEFQDKLSNRFTELIDLKSFAIALNEEYADSNQLINEGDVIAIIPPVSGG